MKHAVVGVAAGLFVLAGTGAAVAQGVRAARSFKQLQVLVDPGDTLDVTDETGRRVRGELLGLSPSLLVLRVSGQRTELSPESVIAIRQRRADSLANGALWGLGVGAAFGATVVAISGTGEESLGGWMLLSAGVYGGVGAGLGVAIDALIRGNQLIYERPPTDAARARQGAPGSQSSGKGANVNLGRPPSTRGAAIATMRRPSGPVVPKAQVELVPASGPRNWPHCP